LHDLRIGADIVALQRAREELPPSAAEAVLRDVAALFHARRAAPFTARPATMLPHLDAALAGVLREGAGDAPGRRAVAALVGLRRNLCPDAPAFLQGETT
jgi:hypothetical protein